MDDYEIAINNLTIGLDKKHSLGRGILILTKKGQEIDYIFPSWNTDRRAFTMVKYDNGSSLILGALHLDQS